LCADPSLPWRFFVSSNRFVPPRPGFAEVFTPKLVTVLKEGYGLAQLRTDAVAGLTVAIVALPLSMAIAIASGASPERGLYTAIVAGFLISPGSSSSPSACCGSAPISATSRIP
jgi:MFS superfamily sulfate permease-like transporter